MRLASEQALESAAAEFAEVRHQFAGYRAEMLDHPAVGWCLRNYLVLTERPELLGEHGLSEAELYWSRYYWLLRFARVWSAVVGHDAGLEQQASQLLEHPPNGLAEWTQVEAAAERAATEQLRAANIG